MKNKTLNEKLCGIGEQADQHLTAGRTSDALKLYKELEREMESGGDFDSYLAAKVTLGQLRAYVKLGDFKNAYSVWNASLEDSLLGIGVYALESAQSTLKDLITYDMLCAFLHTLSDNDKTATASAVNQYLSRVCEQALEDGDRATVHLAINNWKHHLREIFGASIPFDAAKALIHFEKTLDETVKPRSIDFPATSAWEKPRDFLEMSRFTEIKKIKRPAPAKKRAG